MPTLYEGNGVTGCLSAAVAQLWGMKTVPVVGGAGDNAAGAIGVGIVTSGQAMLSLGTSGVYFAVSDGVVANPAAAVHSFCHALPDTWHTMSVMLSAASCLDWLKHLVQAESVAELLAEVESAESVQSELIFLPYLSGERTPHNDPNAQGVFFGMNHDTRRYHLTQAVLEGVGFAFADALDAVHSVTDVPNDISLIGGGARSAYWGQMLADILEVPLSYRTGSEVGPALGAARLAQLAHDSVHTLAQICPVPQLVTRYQPNLLPQRYYRRKRQTFIELYQRLRDLFATSVSNQNDS
jgi:xylulokinase